MKRTLSFFKIFKDLAKLIDFLASGVFYLFMFVILVIPVFKVIEKAIQPLYDWGPSHLGWGFIPVVIVLLILMGWFAEVFADVSVKVLEKIHKIRKGEIMPAFFNMLRSISAAIGMYGFYRMEHFLFNNSEHLNETSILRLIGEFISRL